MHFLVVSKSEEAYDVDITRNSKWGNPFPLSEFTSRGECLEAYERWLPDQRELLADLHELTGQRLGCVCGRERRCHGETLARMANNPFVVKAYANR